MQMRQSEIRNTVKAGVFVILLGILTMVFIFMLSKDYSLFEDRVTLYAKVDNAENLKQGGAVLLKGIRVGSVQATRFETINTIVVEMMISESYLSWIKEDSFIEVRTQGMLGDKYVEVLGGSDNSAVINRNGTLKTNKTAGMKDFINKGENILVTAGNVLGKLDILLNDLNHDHQVKDTMNNLKTLSGKISESIKGESLANAFQNFQTASSEMKKVSKNMSDITHQVKSGPGTMHSLIFDTSISEDLRTLLGGAQRNKILKYFIRESIKKSEKLD